MKNQNWPVAIWRTFLLGLVVVAGLTASPSAEAATQTLARPPAIERVMLQPPGPMIPSGPCGALQMADFSAIPGAPSTIFSTEIVSATDDQPEYCAVTGMIEPQIQFELWLPTTTWNHRYLQVGCGGYCGSLSPSEQCTAGLAQNFAVAFNNTGHVGGSPMSGGDALWATTNQQLRADFGYRSEHVMAVVAKTIIASFYGEAPSYAYYQGCSNGGRQALQEAQTWPEDFDGIIAGAPAAIQAPLNGEYEAWNGRANLDAQGNALLTTADLTLINNAALDNCDDADGLVDGQITDPRRCTFDPTVLLCAPGSPAPASEVSATLPLTAAFPANAPEGTLPPLGAATEVVTSTCLSEAQLGALQKLYRGPTDADGQALYPGHEAVGSELSWGMFAVGSGDMKPMAALIANGYLKYLGLPQSPPAAYSPDDWQFTIEGFDQLREMGQVYNATNPDLSAFGERGGKLILYHGWADPAIPPYGTIAYYQAVQDTMGGLEATQEFARLYMVPGMFHCSGGDAPNMFDLLTPIQDWVEKGVAPTAITATQTSGSGASGGFADPTAGGSSGGQIVRTRPLCPYPLVQQYSGVGDINDAANFECAMPDSDTLIDGHYDWVGNDLFQVDPPTIERPILVNPPAGPAGIVFLFTAAGFAPGERIEIAVGPAGEPDASNRLEDALAQGEGYATWTWTPAADAQPGEYELVAYGTESEVTLVTPVMITAE